MLKDSKAELCSVQDLVVLNAALAELDESSADASCLQALNLAADRLSALLRSGAHMPPHLLCQVDASSLPLGVASFRMCIGLAVLLADEVVNGIRLQQ